MSELPTGWIKTKLGDICSKPQYGYTTRAASAGNVRFLRTTDITKGLNWLLVPYCEENPEKPEQYLLQSGDIVISRAGSVGFSALIESVPENAVFASYLIRFRPLEGVIGKYLKRYLESDYYWQQITEKAAGNALQNVNAQKLADLDVVVAPFAEQTRIAAKLDELLAQVDALKARIDGIPARLKRFRQSVLAAAVAGRLTEEWREQNTCCDNVALNFKARSLGKDELASAEELLAEPLPSFWNKYALEQLVDPERGIPYGIVQTGSAVEKGIPTVRCGDVKNLYIDTSSLKLVSAEIEQDYKRTRLKGGEVLLAIRGSVGNVGVALEGLRGCNISREVAMIPTLPSVLPFYLACLLQSPLGQRLMVGKVRGVAQKGINLADVRRLPVALPPYEEQTEIVRRVEQLFAFADQLEARIKAAQARIDHLTRSILAKAFRGELVPQDPNDESASLLLERIKAQRTATPKAKRGRRSA